MHFRRFGLRACVCVCVYHSRHPSVKTLMNIHGRTLTLCGGGGGEEEAAAVVDGRAVVLGIPQ